MSFVGVLYEMMSWYDSIHSCAHLLFYDRVVRICLGKADCLLPLAISCHGRRWRWAVGKRDFVRKVRNTLKAFLVEKVVLLAR